MICNDKESSEWVDPLDQATNYRFSCRERKGAEILGASAATLATAAAFYLSM